MKKDLRKIRGLQQNHCEAGETTLLGAKMKLSQSTAELAMVSLKKGRQGTVGGNFTCVCTCSPYYKGL